MGVRAALALSLLVMATIEAADGKGNIVFWRNDITLTCPDQGTTWTINGNRSDTGNEYTMKYDGKINSPYYCEYGEDNRLYFFYAKGKTCENCYELDAKLFLLVIVGDVIGTAAVMMAIYKCTKKQSSAASAHPKTSSRSGPAPPTPSRDYEQLNPRTRAQDTYSMVNRTG